MSLDDLKIPLPNHEIVACRVTRGSAAAGRTLAGIDLRRLHGVTILAIRRGAESVPNPDGDFMLAPDDVVVLFGDPAQLAAAMGLFTPTASA